VTEKAHNKDELRNAISELRIPCRKVGFSILIRPWKVVFLDVLMVIAVGLGHQPSAFAQNKAAQTAAGAIIIQNNQMRQELRETRAELKEIKEGLGIESAPSGGGEGALPVALAILIAIVGVVVFIGAMLWLVVRWRSDLTAIRTELQSARRSNDAWQVYKALCNGRGIPTQVFVVMFGLISLFFWFESSAGLERLDSTFNNPDSSKAVEAHHAYEWECVVGSGLWLSGFTAAWFYGLFLYANRLVRRSICAETTDGKVSDEAAAAVVMGGSLAKAKPALLPCSWFVRLPDGTIRGPFEKARVMAWRGRYPSGTQWSNFESGPWEVLVEPKTSPEQSTRFWVRTPQGMNGGPYTREQLSKAIAAGKIPDGSEAASSPDGPWRKIAVKRS
jgi:hypothetical protein